MTHHPALYGQTSWVNFMYIANTSLPLKIEIRTEQTDQTVWGDSGLHIMEIHRLKLMTLLILLLLFISACFTVSFCLANV